MENPNPYNNPPTPPFNTPPNPFFQQQQQPGTYKIGYRYGTTMLIGGAVLTGINYILLAALSRYFPALLVVGLFCMFTGPIYYIFPGKPVAMKPAPKEMGKELWRNAPGLHKAAWIVWGALSIGAAMWVMSYFDLGLFN